ncbi:hypothetical protein NIES2100_16680 [Calothrix sp. NIES-2100]|uniref:hypothetical protein n=1 Tax=Calothrix sp. NIES-2100 TaxID=1954172 RepID=UPI000B5E2154|nr:hypothetical protein NIES2100_16680 [Calothrix sp. NIES-2100]
MFNLTIKKTLVLVLITSLATLLNSCSIEPGHNDNSKSKQYNGNGNQVIDVEGNGNTTSVNRPNDSSNTNSESCKKSKGARVNKNLSSEKCL